MSFLYFFWPVGVCWSLLCLCRSFYIFEWFLHSNPESCCSKQVRYQLGHSSHFDVFVNHSMDFSFSGWQCSLTWPMPAWAVFLEPFILSGWLTFQLSPSLKKCCYFEFFVVNFGQKIYLDISLFLHEKRLIRRGSLILPLLRIRDPESDFFHPGSRIHG